MESLERQVTLFLSQHKQTEFSCAEICEALFPEVTSKLRVEVLIALQRICQKEPLFRKNTIHKIPHPNGMTTYSLNPRIGLSESDTAFQEWLVQENLLTRRPVTFEMLDAIDSSRKDAALLSVLMKYERFLVPYLILSQVVYSEPGASEKIGRLFRALRTQHFIGEKDALVVPNYGIGLSVDSVRLTAKAIELLDILWKADKLGINYTSEMLYKKIWRQFGPRTSEERTKLFVLIDTTRNVLMQTKYDIVTVGERRNSNFLLVKRD